MSFHVPEQYRLEQIPQAPWLNSTKDDGNNGVFFIPRLKAPQRVALWIIASDGDGWEHVSVSLKPRCRPGRRCVSSKIYSGIQKTG